MNDKNKAQLTIRPVQEPADDAALVQLNDALKAAGWARSNNRTLPNTTYLIAKVDGTVVGRCRASLAGAAPAAVGQVGVAVHPAYRDRGYGRQMLLFCLTLLTMSGEEQVVVTCQENNTASRALIESCGGVFDGMTMTPKLVPIRRYVFRVICRVADGKDRTA